MTDLIFGAIKIRTHYLPKKWRMFYRFYVCERFLVIQCFKSLFSSQKLTKYEKMTIIDPNNPTNRFVILIWPTKDKNYPTLITNKFLNIFWEHQFNKNVFYNFGWKSLYIICSKIIFWVTSLYSKTSVGCVKIIY